MSLSFLTPHGEVKIPSGGVNQELINRISDIESRLLDLTDKLAGLESTHADKENYGLVRLSDASSVTQMSGLALPATEKNSALPGTLANMIGSINEKITDQPVLLFSCPQTQVLTEVGRIYDVCSLNIPAGKWFLIGQTLASGDQYIDGVTWGHISRSYAVGEEYERSNRCFAVSGGGTTATLRVNAQVRQSVIHADGAYAFLVAIKFL